MDQYEDIPNVSSFAAAEKLLQQAVYDMKIDLEEGKNPLIGYLFPLSQEKPETLRDCIEETMKNEKIRPSKLSATIPWLFVCKPNDKRVRVVVDYSALNSIIRKEKYSLPHMGELFNRVPKATGCERVQSKPSFVLNKKSY